MCWIQTFEWWVEIDKVKIYIVEADLAAVWLTVESMPDDDCLLMFIFSVK